MTQFLRLFIAIELPESLWNPVRHLIQTLQEVTPRQTIRWVPAENLHLTLKFLGDTPAGEVERIRSAMEQAIQGMSVFDIEMADTGCFPDNKKPRVVWLGLKNPGENLQRLRDRIESQVAPLGYPTEKRPFKAHLTLGRVKQQVSTPRLAEIGQGVHKSSPGSMALWHCDTVSLMKSDLTANGSIYTRLASIALPK